MISTSEGFSLDDKFSFLNGDDSGEKKALLIGINYIGQQGELRGCHNDVKVMKTKIESQGFSPNNITVLLDDGSHTKPTGANIVKAMKDLASEAKAGDSLLFSLRHSRRGLSAMPYFTRLSAFRAIEK